MWTHLRPLLLLTFLALVFFYPLLLHPTQVLYSEHSDFPDLHIPAKRYLVRSVHETGELPLWDPYELTGAPFVHDIQVGMFYPPHAVLYLIPEEWVGAALSWLVVLHVLLAGWFTYAYARDQGLTEVGALVAGVGWMFAGRLMLHLLLGGHYNIIGLAWLPLILLSLERAIRRGSLGWATLGGVAYAFLILGTHPQWTLYASLLVLLWTPAAALQRAGWWNGPSVLPPLSLSRALVRWLLCGVWVVLVGLLLTAVQLLPTAEAASEAMRSGGVGPSGALEGGLRSLVFLVGPALTAQPHNLAWEDRGGLTLLWLALAVTAALAGRGRVRYVAAVGLVLALFGVGASVLVQAVPPFRLFRQPPRMFVLVGFPVALLAGYGMDLLLGDTPTSEKFIHRARSALPRVVAIVAILTGGFAVRSLLEGRALQGHVYWLSLLITLPTALLLLLRLRAWGRAGALALGTLLLVDLWALSMPSVETRPQTELYAPPACVQPLLGQPAGEGRVLDRAANGTDAAPLGGGACMARIWKLEAVRGYNPLDYRRFKEYLQFAAGSDTPVQPQAGPLGFPVLGNFRVNEKSLIDVLNVRYLLTPTDEPPPASWGKARTFPAGPGVFNFLAGGVPPLTSYALYENPTALPRAFVVFQAAPLPPREKLLDRLKQTDFRREVLLEEAITPSSGTLPPAARAATITHYLPNRVEVNVEDGAPGWLVLADPWYPGWHCAIDGQPAHLLRANFLLRAVAIPTGAHTITFSFEPDSYRLGRWVSLATLAGVVLIFGLLAARHLVHMPRHGSAATAPPSCGGVS